MSDKKKIWIGPGVLRPGPDSKRKKVVEPGEEVEKGVVTSDRIKQLEKAGKIVTSADYTRNLAAAGVAPVENAAGKIKALESDIKGLQEENKTLKGGDGGLADANQVLADVNEACRKENKELQATNESLEASLKQFQKTNEDLVSGSVELQEANEALKVEVENLKKVKK